MKIAIVHDYLNQFGGAERVVEVMHEIYPKAPIYTSIYLPHRMPESFRKMDIRTSFMQKLPGLDKHFKKYLPLYPLAFKSFDMSEYDIILSSSSAFAKGVKKRKDAKHICYCYTPARFMWRYKDYVEKEDLSFAVRVALPLFIRALKKWDIRTNSDIDFFIAISEYIAKRIESIYNRKSEVIYPPVNVLNFSIESSISDHFLIVSRLNAYKRIDLAVKAFNKLGLQLKIIGDGPHRKYLESIAGPNIEFLGKVPDKDLPAYYSGCRALVFPGEEDFGIVPVEAQAAGRPVIAYGSGGALETVVENKTGVFFNEATPESLAGSVESFLKMDFDPEVIRRNALLFDKEVFMKAIREFVNGKS